MLVYPDRNTQYMDVQVTIPAEVASSERKML